MDELLKQILREAQAIWRHRWVAVTTAWVLAVLGWAVVLALPDVYEATSRVYVDTESAARAALKGVVVDSDVENRVRLVRQAMLSRPNIEEVARKTDLDLRVSGPREFEALVDELRQDIHVSSAGETTRGRASQFEQNLYTISYRDQNRKMAEAVVQVLVNAFVEGSLGQRRNSSDQAVDFLRGQVAEYERRLNEKEKDLADFKRQNVGRIPGEGGDYFARLQKEMQSADAVRSELAIAQQRRRALQAQLAASRSTGDGSVSPAAELEAQIAEQEARLRQLLLLYTDKHPDVIATRETLKSLRERMAALGDTGAGTGGGTLVVENVRIALNEVEVEIAALQGRLAQHEGRIAELRRMVDTIPEVEAQYAQLSRDYGVTKAQYEELLERLEQAQISGDVGRQGSDVQFEVIDPPSAAQEPVAPDRPRLLIVVLAVALAGGAGVAWMLSQVRPVFVSRRGLYEELGRPVLGSVSMAWTTMQKLRLRTSRMSLIMAVALLLAVFGVVFVFQQPATRFAQSMIG